MIVSSNKQKKLILYAISFLTAVIIWIFISYSENPMIDIRLKTVPVNFSGESVLIDNNLMIVNKKSIPKAEIVIRGKRRDLINVLGNISANVDLSSITKKGTYKITPTFDISSSTINISKRETDYIEFEVDEIISKTVDVKVSLEKTENNDLYIIEPVPEASKIEVKGTYDDISQIKCAVLTLDASSINENCIKDCDIVFVDRENAPIPFENDVICEKSSLAVSNKVYEKATLPVSLSIPEMISDKYKMNVLSCETTEITVGLKNKTAKRIKSITNKQDFSHIVPGDSVIYLETDIPKGIFIPEESKKIKITAEVFENSQKNITVPINVINADSVSYILPTKSVEISVSGPNQMLFKDNIVCNLDFGKIQGLSAGSHRVKLDVYSKQKKVTVNSGDIYVDVTIK